MERRRTLGILFTVGTVVAAAMVLFPSIFPFGGPPNVTTSDSPSLQPSLSDPYPVQKGEQVTVIQVGEGTDGLPLQIWNDNPERRTVSIELLHNRSDSTIVTRTVPLPRNAIIRLELRSPDGYLLRVTDESTGTTGTYAVTPDHFDCNDRLATVRITGTNITSRTLQTAMGCGGIFALSQTPVHTLYTEA